MQKNAGSYSGWRCAVKENARSSARRRVRRAEHPELIRAELARRVCVGRTYFGYAKTAEEATQINHHVRNRLADFKNRQASERKETNGRLDEAVA